MSSKEEADYFFNAYLVLKQNDEALMDKLQELAGKPLVGSKELGTRPTLGVDIVCLAFAVELYIKDVYFAWRGEAPHGHDILKLFEALSEDIRQEIFSHASISQNPYATRPSMMFPLKKSATAYDGFIEQIKLISDGFVKWRYSYEAGTLQYNSWFAEALIEAMVSIASDVRKTMNARKA